MAHLPLGRQQVVFMSLVESPPSAMWKRSRARNDSGDGEGAGRQDLGPHRMTTRQVEAYHGNG